MIPILLATALALPVAGFAEESGPGAHVPLNRDMEGQRARSAGGMGKVQEGMILSFDDTDEDGAVRREEFPSHATDRLAPIDRDGSGDVTRTDFGPRG